MPSSGLYQTLKLLIKQTVEAGKPMDFEIGTVSKVSPVEITVNEKLKIPEACLLFTYTADYFLEKGAKMLLLRLPGGNRYMALDRLGTGKTRASYCNSPLCPCLGGGSTDPGDPGTTTGGGGAKAHNLSKEVEGYRAKVTQYAAKYGMSDYVELILAVMMQESGGKGNDPMQASEGEFNTKYDNKPNSIQDPDYSIQCGIQELKKALQTAGAKGPTDTKGISMALQIYNYGPGFYLGRADGKWSGCKEWSQAQANAYHNATGEGDNLYVAHVMRYYSVSSSGSTSSSSTSAAGSKIISYGEKFLGVPYVFGGFSPSGFDCSGFVCYVYTHSGVKNVSRTTAQGLYNQCKKISKSALQVGDLVFFTGTYDSDGPVSHVAIYAGNNRILQASGDRVNYGDLSSTYWQKHLYGYGRLL